MAGAGVGETSEPKGACVEVLGQGVFCRIEKQQGSQ